MKKLFVILLAGILIICLIGCEQEQKESTSVSDELSAKEMVVELMKWEFPKIDAEEYDVTEWLGEFLEEMPEVKQYVIDYYAVGKTDWSMKPVLLGYLRCDDRVNKEISDQIQDILQEKLEDLSKEAAVSPFVGGSRNITFGVMSGDHSSYISIYQSWIEKGRFADSEESSES